MKINNVNCQGKNATFGYNLPKYCNYERSISTESFINEVCQRKRAKSQAEYEKYMQALKNFKAKRFDARGMYKLYKSQIAKLDKRAAEDYIDYIDKIAPTYTVMEPTKVTREGRVKEPFFRRFLNFIQGKPPKMETITETVEKPVEYYDLSKINATLTGIKFTRYGSFFTGDNPPHDCYEIILETGRDQTVLERFSEDNSYRDVSKDADKRLQAMLSDANALDALSSRITKCVENCFKWNCDYIMERANGRAELEQKWRGK